MAVLARAFPRRLLVNSASIFGGEAIARLATFLMAVIIARRFGSVALGEYGYALAMASILLMVPDLGLNLFAVRELSADKRRLRTIFWSIHWLKTILTGIVIVFALFFGEWGIANEGRRLLFYVLIVRVLLQTFSQASMAIFKAFERMQYDVLSKVRQNGDFRFNATSVTPLENFLTNHPAQALLLPSVPTSLRQV